jgi:hypothetical protein
MHSLLITRRRRDSVLKTNFARQFWSIGGMNLFSNFISWCYNTMMKSSAFLATYWEKNSRFWRKEGPRNLNFQKRCGRQNRGWSKFSVVGVGSLEEEAYWKLGASHIQDGRYGGHIENTNSTITPSQMARSIKSKFLSWVHIFDIITGFLIWPTFQGHRLQSSIRIARLARFVTAGIIDLKLSTYVPP